MNTLKEIGEALLRANNAEVTLSNIRTAYSYYKARLWEDYDETNKVAKLQKEFVEAVERCLAP